MTIRSRAYTASCLCIALGVAAASLWAASREWFHGDDFAFLWWAKQGFDPVAAFLPIDPRVWPTYRPLTIEVYFGALQSWFGTDPRPFLGLVVAAHFASGFVVARIARQLGFDGRLALFAGVLSVALYPSLSSMFWASAFQHVAAIGLCLLCVSAFLSHLQHRSRAALAASLVCFALALLSNELAASLPGVLALLGWERAVGGPTERLRGLARQIAPHAALLGAYLVLRFFVIHQAPMHPAYSLALGSHVFENALRNLAFLLREHWALATGFALLGVAAQASRPDRARSGVLAGWWALAALPTLGIPEIVPRMAMSAEAPFALFVADQLDAALRRRPHLPAWAVEAVLVLLLLAAIPYGVLQERIQHPEGELNRKLAASLEAHFADLAEGECIDIRLHPDIDWDDATLDAWRYRAHNLPNVLYGNDSHELVFQRMSEVSRSCVASFQLAPGLKLTAVKRHGPRRRTGGGR